FRLHDAVPISYPVHRGGAASTGPHGQHAPAPDPRSRGSRTTRSSTSRGTTPRHTPAGPVCGYRPRPSGSTTPEEGWTKRPLPGGENYNRLADTASPTGVSTLPSTIRARLASWV